MMKTDILENFEVYSELKKLITWGQGVRSHSKTSPEIIFFQIFFLNIISQRIETHLHTVFTIF